MYEELIKRLRDIASHDSNIESNYIGLALLQAADAIEVFSKKEKTTQWIPVTERLPEHGWYLAYGPTIKMEVLHFHSVEEVWSSERYYNIEVTHWMPLPEPPKEG